MDVNEELKFLGTFTKKIRGGGRVGGGGGSQGGCELRIEVFVKIKIKKIFGVGGVGGIGFGGGGGQGGVNEEFNFLGTFTK